MSAQHIQENKKDSCLHEGGPKRTGTLINFHFYHKYRKYLQFLFQPFLKRDILGQSASGLNF